MSNDRTLLSGSGYDIWYDADEDTLTLSSGRYLYVHAGIVGLNRDGDVSHGYDGKIRCDDWSHAERKELADYMISRWREFADCKSGE